MNDREHYDAVNDMTNYYYNTRKETEMLMERVDKIILDTANEITEYLKDDSIPMECYVKDIDAKMNLMRKMVKTELDALYE